MTDTREFWIQAKDEYEKALAIATRIWTTNADPAVLNAVTATLLIHFDRLRSNGRRPSGQAPLPHRPPAPADVLCPECNRPMVRTAKKNPKEPDFRCSDNNCRADGEHTTAGWIDRKNGRIKFSKRRDAVAAGGYGDDGRS